MADRGRKTPLPSARPKTLDGMPSPRPSRPPIVESTRPRLTLNFSGPPLALDETVDDEPKRPSLELALDTSMLILADVEGHDAWTNDRRRRSTTPPPRGMVGEIHPLAAGVRSGSRRATPSGSLPAVIDESDAYRLIERSRPSLSLDLASEVAERFALGDFTGALRAAELWLGADPESVPAKNYAASCREHLEQFYQSRLGSFERIAHVAVAQSEIRWLGLDHRAGFFLSRVDGMTTVDELLDLSGMPRLEALATLVELLDMGAVRLS